MARKNIILRACDDSTTVPVEVSEDQLALLLAISKASLRRSGYACQPTLHVRDPGDEGTVWDEYAQRVVDPDLVDED